MQQKPVKKSTTASERVDEVVLRVQINSHLLDFLTKETYTKYISISGATQKLKH